MDQTVKPFALATLLLLAGCSTGTAQTNPSSSPHVSPAGRVTEAPISTACPPVGKARAAVLTPMLLGTNPAVVYSEQPPANGGPVSSTLISYEVTTKARVNILSAVIDEAVVSPDGQWITFTTTASASPMLQLVRMDGSRRQTLYCAAPNGGIRGPLWSPDQKSLLFATNAGSGAPTIYELKTATGELTPVLRDNSLSTDYIPASWADSSHLVVSGHSSGLGPGAELSLLDLKRGANQVSSDLVQLSSSVATCFDVYGDGSTVYTSKCNGSFSDTGGSTLRGPSEITAQPTTGGSKRNVFTSPTLAVTQVRAAASGQLLLSVGNQEPAGSAGTGAMNGLWRVNADGSGLTQLVKATNTQGQFNLFSQTSWANLSRDGRLYAFELSKLQKVPAYSLVVGAVAGGPPSTIATRVDGGQLLIVGWTAS
ncbi:MAG TPA: hypothetical protein VGD57_01790 [Candidatus Dormibacteraeota bacterium]